MNKSEEKSYMNTMEEKCLEKHLSETVRDHIMAQLQEAMEEYLKCLGKEYTEENVMNVLLSDDEIREEASRLLKCRVKEDIEKSEKVARENSNTKLILYDVWIIFSDEEKLAEKILMKRSDEYLKDLLPELIIKYLYKYCKYEHFCEITQEWLKSFCIELYLSEKILMDMYEFKK